MIGIITPSRAVALQLAYAIDCLRSTATCSQWGPGPHVSVPEWVHAYPDGEFDYVDHPADARVALVLNTARARLALTTLKTTWLAKRLTNTRSALEVTLDALPGETILDATWNPRVIDENGNVVP